MSEKENISKPSTSSRVNIDTPTSAKKSLFKKIGTRKLILMNKSGKISDSPHRGKSYYYLFENCPISSMGLTDSLSKLLITQLKNFRQAKFFEDQ